MANGVKIKGQSPVKKLEQRLRRLESQVDKALNSASAMVKKQLLERHLRGGTTDDRLRRRTGTLARSIKQIKPFTENKVRKTAVASGCKYMRVHFGPKGSETTIRPKKGRYLAIPLPAAQTAAGVARGGPLAGVWGKTFIARSKAGNLIIFGQSNGTKRGGGNGPIPLFVLKSFVKIPRRIDPKLHLLAWVAPYLKRDLQIIAIGGRI